MDLTTRSQVSEYESNRPAVVFGIMHAVLFIASLIVIPALAPSARIPNPFGPDEPSRHFFLENAAVIRLSDWLQLASAMCLALLGCVWSKPQQLSASTHTTRSLIFGGSLGSAALLTLAAVTSWSLASPGGADPGAAFHALQFLPFLLGGPGWAAFFAVFMLGVSRASVGRIPSWLVWTGYGLSITSALATMVLITLAAAPFLPLTRFIGFLWLITAATLLSSASKR
jgi:hypothetical protein